MKLYFKSLRYIILNLFAFFPIGILAQNPSFKASVAEEIIFSEIPSASGIVKFEGSYFIIGDDSPFLFQLNSKFELIHTIKLLDGNHSINERLPKKDKPDLECITVAPWGNDKDLLVFGSGSTNERNVMYRIDIDNDDVSVKDYSLKELYNKLEKETDPNKQINIEGAGYWNGNLFLLNRSDNTLFLIDYKDFKKYLKDKDDDMPKIEAINFNLPSQKGIPAKFSGLTVLEHEEIILFTASVENQPNWVVNEDIVSSYLGVIDINQLDNSNPICKLITYDNIAIKEKVESVCYTNITDSYVKLIGVVDNDNGSSKLLKITFNKL